MVIHQSDPSPDWFVGVSGLELCLENCSWVEHKELNLYPVDAGTDDGVTYESIDKETEPRDVIRRITTTWPADEQSPFYDPTAIDMNPLARLYIKRQRIYEKECAGGGGGRGGGGGNRHVVEPESEEGADDNVDDSRTPNRERRPDKPHKRSKYSFFLFFSLFI